MPTPIGRRLDIYEVTRPPRGACHWCIHTAGKHHKRQGCLAMGCLCQRYEPNRRGRR